MHRISKKRVMTKRIKHFEETDEFLRRKDVCFISLKEAADIAGVTCETIRNLCVKGAIRYQQKGRRWYPCEVDVIKKANTIYKIHSLEINIEHLNSQLKKERRELLKEREEYKMQLVNMNMSPLRLLRMEKLIYSLLQHYIKENEENLSEREITILFKMFRGDATSDIAKELKISGSRVGQIWTRLLQIIASAKNALEQKDEEISSLRETIQQIDDKISFDTPVDKHQNNMSNVDLLFGSIENCSFTTHTINALKKAKIETIYDLIDHPRRDIEIIPHLGKKSLNEIDLWLEIHGLDYGMHGVDLSELRDANQQSKQIGKEEIDS